VPTFYYSRDSEHLRRLIQRTEGPSIGVPSTVFIVKTHVGDEIHIPTRLLTKHATIVVGGRKSTKSGHSIVVTVTNRVSRTTAVSSGGTKDAITALAGEAVGGAAKHLAKPLIDNAGKAVEKEITNKLGRRVGGNSAMGVGGYSARQAGGFAARQLTGLAVKTAASKAVSAAAGGPAGILELAISAASTGPGAERHHTTMTGKSSAGVPVTIFVSGARP